MLASTPWGVSAPGGCMLLGGAWSRGCLVWGVWSGGSGPRGGQVLGGWGCLLWGVWSGGVCSQGGVCSGGVWGIPACTEAEPPCGQNSQMPVKTLPWPNFVAASNNSYFRKHIKMGFCRICHGATAVYIVGFKGTPGTPPSPGVQILSFSCSFRQKFEK